MKNEFSGDRSDMQNHYGSYGSYNSSQYTSYGSTRYGAYNNYGNYGYGLWANSDDAGPQRTLKIILHSTWTHLVSADCVLLYFWVQFYTFNKTKLYTAYATIELLRDIPR